MSNVSSAEACSRETHVQLRVTPVADSHLPWRSFAPFAVKKA